MHILGNLSRCKVESSLLSSCLGKVVIAVESLHELGLISVEGGSCVFLELQWKALGSPRVAMRI